MQIDIKERVGAAVSGRPALTFGEFLALLFQHLAAKGVSACVLRNYEGFPDRNAGGDLDLFIARSDMPNAIRALRAIPRTRMVGASEHFSGSSFFMEGICPVSGIRAFQVDLITGLDWKGLPYLPAETLLSGAVPRRAGNLEFFVPSPAHEAIVSLLTSLLVSGALKEKYLPNVERTFKRERARVEAALIPQFGAKTVAQLVDAVIAGDRPKMLSCVRPMRISLGLRSLMRRPFRSVRAAAAHYWREFAIRCLPGTLETVCISAPEGLSKAEVVDRLIPMLKTSAKFVQKRDLGRTIFPSSRLHHESAKAAGRAQAPLNSIASMRNVCLWLVREWLSKFERRENLTLRIEESHPIDLVIDPESYRYGGPMWFARLGCKFYPLPELWILLENQVRGGDSIDSEPIPKRSVNQLESICTSVKLKSRCVVFDASRPADFLAEEVYRAIIDALDQRTAERLKRYK